MNDLDIDDFVSVISVCPFCNRGDSLVIRKFDDGEFAVVHIYCGAQGPKKSNPKRAIAVWDMWNEDRDNRVDKLEQLEEAETALSKMMDIAMSYWRSK